MRYKLLLGIGQSLDSITFAAFFLLIPAAMVQIAGKTERNPIAAFILVTFGFMGVVVLKQLLSAFAIWRLSKNNALERRRFKFLSGIAGIAGIVGATFNTIAILQVLTFT